MNPMGSTYVEYGTGNMLNLGVGTIKRKIDSNEYDDEILHEAQPNGGKRTCNSSNSPSQNYTFGSVSGGWLQSSSPSQSLSTSIAAIAPTNGFAPSGYQTPESVQSSVAASPFAPSMDMDMETESFAQDPHAPAPMTIQTTNAVLNTAISAPTTSQSSTLLPSALPASSQSNHHTGSTEFVPVHGRSMEIPSYARVPLNEVRKYREQRWSSCIYAADTRLGQGMMI
ncbi:hypothetical protein B0O80DRAFT_503306 [Mortierella sp. GBAus27b]|nr:hypothetical protein BGX31_006174 [Mortierella sp. GBA43]KAI8346666.1 hypothetical protein B0O80DRAFT_503306 [Mortierella sp. GBAus27b]